jgi:hypothetical protein
MADHDGHIKGARRIDGIRHNDFTKQGPVEQAHSRSLYGRSWFADSKRGAEAIKADYDKPSMPGLKLVAAASGGTRTAPLLGKGDHESPHQTGIREELPSETTASTKYRPKGF